MILKLFREKNQKPPPSSRLKIQVPATSAAVQSEEKSSGLRIVHAGGLVETYYMAVPASRILEKYPSFVIARPDVFRRPWDALVRPEEILKPGQKFFIVPRQTLKKLRRRIRKPSAEIAVDSFVSAESVSSKINVSISTVDGSKDDKKPKNRIRRVRFFGVGTKEKSDSISVEKKGNAEENSKKNLEGKRKTRKVVMWHPALTSIIEIHDSDE